MIVHAPKHLALARFRACPPHRYTVEICARARLRPNARAELVLPDDIAGTDLAGRPEMAEIFGALEKPKADLLLSGTAYAPGKKAVPSLRVRFSVGRHSRELTVLGDRDWDPVAKRASEPKPFVSLPITYERAYGGAGYPDNPTGRGHGKDDEAMALPNILDAKDVDAGRVARAPAGFLPLSRAWGFRSRKGGTFDDRWLAERWPDFPADLDPAFFNAAPPELQVAALRGDEPVVLENLHPEHPRYESALPGLRVRLFVLTGDRFDEIALRLDTLWIDMSTELATLLWRGHLDPVGDDAQQHALCVTEPLAEPPLPAEHYRQELSATLLVDAPELVDLDEVAPANQNEVEPDVDEALKKALAPVRDMLEKGGASAGVLAAFDSGDLDGMVKSLQTESGVTDEQMAAQIQRVKSETREMLVREGVDPAVLDEPEEIEPPAPITRKDVIARHQAGESLAEEDLTGLDLSELDLSGAVFTGAILTNVKLTATRLARAELSLANLAGADLSAAGLSEAQLGQADLTGAKLTGADLSRAHLGGALLRETDLERATLDHVEASRAAFEGANLENASLRDANLEEAYLGSCQLEGASFQRANLTRAVLERSTGVGVDFSDADLTYLKAAEGTSLPKAKLRGAKGQRSTWANADLRGADLSFATLHGVDLSGVDLEGANLHGADLRNANLDDCRLLRAVATHANLFRVSLIRAALGEADFRDACLFEAEFLYSQRDGARFDRAQLDGTKLAPGAPKLPKGV